jgi:hypothetical protein
MAEEMIANLGPGVDHRVLRSSISSETHCCETQRSDSSGSRGHTQTFVLDANKWAVPVGVFARTVEAGRR